MKTQPETEMQRFQSPDVPRAAWLQAQWSTQDTHFSLLEGHRFGTARRGGAAEL